jgi:sarcosine oxidase, subunit beta
MQRYSFAALARHALGGHRGWRPLWRKASPKQRYHVVIIGGGGHGLATAYYLAKEHGIRDVAVLEKGPIGLGNTGRNTTIIRSNYLWDESARLYEHSLKLWEGLSVELNFNLMLSQRGVLNLAHTLADVREGVRRVNANRLSGVDAEWLEPEAVREFCPILSISPDARHDAVAWGYARAADAMGVDIIENCEVTAIRVSGGRVGEIETTRGTIFADKIAISAAGHNSVVAAMAGVRLPLQSHPLQALVSEPVKPVLDCVVMSNTVHVYVSQSDKGELVMGAGIDAFSSYAQRGSFPIIEAQMAAALELFPIFSRLKMLRSWAGIVDVCPDASPIIGKLPVAGLYLNGGWGTGGFKATPGAGHVFAHTITHDAPHPLAAPFALDRFTTGALVDEHGAAAVAH